MDCAPSVGHIVVEIMRHKIIFFHPASEYIRTERQKIEKEGKVIYNDNIIIYNNTTIYSNSF